MKVSLTLSDFPMQYYREFKEDLAKYVKASVQTGGGDTVFVTFSCDDVATTQCACIVCDRYQFEKGVIKHESFP